MLEPMDCLRDGIPLSLMMDLLDDEGPDAQRLYASEHADLAWVHSLVHDHAPDEVHVRLPEVAGRRQ